MKVELQQNQKGDGEYVLHIKWESGRFVTFDTSKWQKTISSFDVSKKELQSLGLDVLSLFRQASENDDLTEGVTHPIKEGR